jgi:hypothetical protein
MIARDLLTLRKMTLLVFITATGIVLGTSGNEPRRDALPATATAGSHSP